MWKKSSLYIVFALSSIAFLYPLLWSGLPVGHDLELEMIRFFAHRTAVLQQGWPLVASILYGGYGSPIFMFYPPMLLWITSVLSFVVFDIMLALKIGLLVFATVSGWYFYKMLRRSSADISTSVLGALLWMSTPYKYVQVFERNSFAEYASMMLLPVVFYVIIRYFEDASVTKKTWVPLVLVFALFLLSHNVVVLLSTLFVVPFLLWVWKYHTKKILPFFLLLGISLLLTAWFWMPIVAYREFMNPQELLMGKFLLERNFVNFQSLHTFGHFLYLSPVILVLPIINIVAFYRHREAYLKNLGGAFAFVSCVFAYSLLFAFSEWFWDLFSFYKIAQFPWRVLAYISFFFVWNGVVVLRMLLPQRLLYATLSIGVVLSCILILLRYGHWDMRTLSLDAGRIASKMISTTVGNEYVPPYTSIPKEVSKKDMNATHNSIEYCTHAIKDDVIRLPIFYFPYWNIRVNNKVVELQDDSQGFVAYSAPSDGEFCLAATLQVPFWQKLGMMITLLGIGWMIVLYKKSSP